MDKPTESTSPSPSRSRWSRRKAATLIFPAIGVILFLTSATQIVSFQKDFQTLLQNAMLLSPNSTVPQSNQTAAKDPTIIVDAVLQNTANSTSRTSCVPASLLLFGVPKEFRCIWKHYMKYIVQANPHIDFEAHIHLYSDLHLSSFTNAKNNENNVTIESPSVIRSILDGSFEMQKAGNNSQQQQQQQQPFTIPTRLVSSSQNEYDAKNLSWIEERDTKDLNSILAVPVLKNVFRQGNSIHEAYTSATSHPFLGNATNKTYIFLRSDTLLWKPIIIPCNGLATNEIHIPSWQTKGFPEYNDRTAVAGPVAAYRYARAKSHIFKEIILDRRNKRGEERLKWASHAKMGTLHNPEKMLKAYLDHASEDSTKKIRVKERELNWAQLIRVRAGGLLHDGGRWKAPKYLNQTDHCR